MDLNISMSRRRSRESGISAKTSLFTFDYVRKKKPKSSGNTKAGASSKTSDANDLVSDRSERDSSPQTTSNRGKVNTDRVRKTSGDDITRKKSSVTKATERYLSSEEEEVNEPETRARVSSPLVNRAKRSGSGPVRKKTPKKSTKATESYQRSGEEASEHEAKARVSSPMVDRAKRSESGPVRRKTPKKTTKAAESYQSSEGEDNVPEASAGVSSPLMNRAKRSGSGPVRKKASKQSTKATGRYLSSEEEEDNESETRARASSPMVNSAKLSGSGPSSVQKKIPKKSTTKAAVSYHQSSEEEDNEPEIRSRVSSPLGKVNHTKKSDPVPKKKSTPGRKTAKSYLSSEEEHFVSEARARVSIPTPGRGRGKRSDPRSDPKKQTKLRTETAKSTKISVEGVSLSGKRAGSSGQQTNRAEVHDTLRKKSTPIAKADESYESIEIEEEDNVTETRVRGLSPPAMATPAKKNSSVSLKESKQSTKAAEIYQSSEEEVSVVVIKAGELSPPADHANMNSPDEATEDYEISEEEDFSSETSAPAPGPSVGAPVVVSNTSVKVVLKEVSVNLQRIDPDKIETVLKTSKGLKRSSSISTLVPQREFQEFVIEQKQSEYLTLRNSGDNRLTVLNDFTANTASYMTPEICAQFETCQGEDDSIKMSMGHMSQGMRCGYYKIKARSVLPPDTMGDCAITFWLIEGNLTVKSCGGYVTYNNGIKVLYPQQLTKGACIHIPPKTCYTFENWGTTDVLLGYTAIKSS